MSDDDLKLTPTQDLIMEVLLARHRVGEPSWPIECRNRAALDGLVSLGLVSYDSGPTEGTFRTRLTYQGKKAYSEGRYVTPYERRVVVLIGKHKKYRAPAEDRFDVCTECSRSGSNYTPYPCEVRKDLVGLLPDALQPLYAGD